MLLCSTYVFIVEETFKMQIHDADGNYQYSDPNYSLCICYEFLDFFIIFVIFHLEAFDEAHRIKLANMKTVRGNQI